MSLRKSRTERLQAQVRDQSAALAGTLSDTLHDKVAPGVGTAVNSAKVAVHSAQDWAGPRVETAVDWAGPKVEAAREWTGPKVEAARDWAGPKLEKGWQASVSAAAPAVESAVDKVTPAVDATRDKLVDDLLPRLVGAVHNAAEHAQQAAVHAAAPAVAAAGAAAVAGKEAAGEAKHRSGDALAVLKGEATAKRKKGGAVKKVLLVGLVLGLGAAAFSALRGKKQEDPWAAPGAAWTPPTSPVAPVPTPPDAADDSSAVAEHIAADLEEPTDDTEGGAEKPRD